MNSSSKDNVVDLGTYRNKVQQRATLARGRKPLFMSHGRDNNAPADAVNGTKFGEFDERIHRIKASLEKINSLMAELKRIARAQKH